ncbi:hypothetical protein [Paraglaciecola sp.]|uniref:hypothetical protein n=1 Tax=Paraglaciecola sp. TaxID=1920173 RepID=UPI003EF56EFF
MKKIILFCLLTSAFVFAEKVDLKQVLIEAVKIDNQIKEQTKDKSLVEKILFIENFAKEYSNNPIVLDLIMQELSAVYSFAGSHRKTLIARDATVEIDTSGFENLTGYQEKDAVVEILERAKNHQIVMVNEAHDIAQHRVLTYRLLQGLWKQGYRYFAAETLTPMSSEQIDKGFITSQVGYYTDEALHANLVLKAKEIGFEVVSYDQHKPSVMNTTDERETHSALTIKEKVFDKDPSAKIVIHVGYSHINEEKWLASKLKNITKLETLTIDQTTRIERSQVKYEHPTYTNVVKSVNYRKPFIFVKGNEVWSSDNKWDISVFWPRTRYLNGRAEWATLNRKPYISASKHCKNLYPCMIEVFKFNQPYEVPLDRVIISSKSEPKAVFLSQGGNTLVVSDGRGNQIAKITLQN